MILISVLATLVGLTDGYAIATESIITLSSRPAVLKKVGCDGTEDNVSQCSHVIDRDIRCIHLAAGVICRKNDSCKFTLVT